MIGVLVKLIYFLQFELFSCIGSAILLFFLVDEIYVRWKIRGEDTFKELPVSYLG